MTIVWPVVRSPVLSTVRSTVAGIGGLFYSFDPAGKAAVASDDALFDAHARTDPTQRIVRNGDGSIAIASIPSGEPALGGGGRYDSGMWGNTRTDTGSRYVDPAQVRPVQNYVADADKNPSDWVTLNAGTGSAPSLTSGYAAGPGGTPASATRVQLDRGAGTGSGDYSAIRLVGPGDTTGKRKCSFWAKSTDQTTYNVDINAEGIGGAMTTVSMDSTFKRFAVAGDALASFRLHVALRGNTGSSQTCDILIAVEDEYYAQIEEDETEDDGIPGESVAPGNCEFFKNAKGNTVDSGVVTEATGAAYDTFPLALEMQPAGTNALTDPDQYCRQANNWTSTNTTNATSKLGLFSGEVADQIAYSSAGAEIRSTATLTFDGNTGSFTWLVGVKMPLVGDGSNNVLEFEVYNSTAAAATAACYFKDDDSFSQIGALRDANATMFGEVAGWLFDSTTSELFKVVKVSLVTTDTNTNNLEMAVKLLASGCEIRPIYAGQIKNNETPLLIVDPDSAQNADTFSETLSPTQTVDRLTLRAEFRPHGKAQAPAGGATVDAIHVRDSADDDPEILIRRDTMTGTPRLVMVTTVGASSRTDVIDSDLTSAGDDDAWWRIAVSVGDGNIRIASSRDGAAWAEVDAADARDWSAKTYDDVTLGGDAALLDIRSAKVLWNTAQSLAAMESGW